MSQAEQNRPFPKYIAPHGRMATVEVIITVEPESRRHPGGLGELQARERERSIGLSRLDPGQSVIAMIALNTWKVTARQSLRARFWMRRSTHYRKSAEREPAGRC